MFFCPFREFDDGPDPDEDDGTAGQGNGGPNGAQVWLQKAKFVIYLLTWRAQSIK